MNITLPRDACLHWQVFLCSQIAAIVSGRWRHFHTSTRLSASATSYWNDRFSDGEAVRNICFLNARQTAALQLQLGVCENAMLSPRERQHLSVECSKSKLCKWSASASASGDCGQMFQAYDIATGNTSQWEWITVSKIQTKVSRLRQVRLVFAMTIALTAHTHGNIEFHDRQGSHKIKLCLLFLCFLARNLTKFWWRIEAKSLVESCKHVAGWASKQSQSTVKRIRWPWVFKLLFRSAFRVWVLFSAVRIDLEDCDFRNMSTWLMKLSALVRHQPVRATFEWTPSWTSSRWQGLRVCTQGTDFCRRTWRLLNCSYVHSSVATLFDWNCFHETIFLADWISLSFAMWAKQKRAQNQSSVFVTRLTTTCCSSGQTVELSRPWETK